MVLDGTAVVSIFLRRKGHESLLERLASATQPAIGAPTLASACHELFDATGRDLYPQLQRFCQELGVIIVPFTEAHYRVATDAIRRYGRGRHPAALNLEDCLSYAVARVARQPLLSAAPRFRSTDLDLA